jgi:maltose O-acetyltransferase
MRTDQTALLAIDRVLKGLRRRLMWGYYSRVLKSMGRRCIICGGVSITQPQNVSLGDGVVINDGVILQSCEGAEITLGDYVTLSYRAMLITGGLDRRYEAMQERNHIAKGIVIERCTWIGAGAIILPGVTVGSGAIVGAGSVVTRSVTSHTMVAGVPARTIRVLG